MTPGEQFEVLQKIKRLEGKVNLILLNGAELLQTLINVRDEVKELETNPDEDEQRLGKG